MSYQEIIYDQTGPIARILHNRPHVRNAQGPVLLDEIDHALGVAIEDPEIRVIVIGATGDHFSAGHDLKEAQANRANFTPEDRWELEERIYLGYCLRIWDCPKPTIAQVQGACIAGGFMVANMCDLMIASEDAFFSDPVLHSLSTAAVEVLIHPYVLGMRKAREFLYTGSRLTAAEGREIGMINKVVPRDNLEAAVFEMATRIAQVSPFALRLTKRSLNRAMDLGGFRNAIQSHFDTHQLGHLSTEANAIRKGGVSKTIGKSA